MIRNYEYGLLEPVENAELILDQMRAGHRYRNKLVEIERDRRTAYAAILAGHPEAATIAADVARLEAELEAARGAITGSRQRTRDRSETAEMRDRVAAIITPLREARAALRAAKAIVRENAEVAVAIADADERSKQRVRAARAACGTYWGTYLLAEQAMDAAKKSPTPPRFLPFRGEGRISVQLQGGLELDALWGGDTQIAIAPVAPTAHDQGAARGARRLASRTVLRLRVQSTDKGRPIWAAWPMILHRPIPDGARVKVATVSRRRRDCRTWEWRLLLTLDIPDASRPSGPSEGAVALNLGWRQTGDDAVRAGYLVSDDGAIDREVVVQRSTIDRVEKASSLRSIRDQNLDQMRATLVAWMHEHEANLPDWLVERTILSRPPRPVTSDASNGGSAPSTAETSTTSVTGQLDALPVETGASVRDAPADRRRAWHVAQWRSADRFRSLAFAWRSLRFDGDAAGYDIIEAWRYRDEHLERYESGMRRGALLDRRERYRVLAADLARRYRTLVVDDFDLRTFQESPAPEDPRVEITAVKRNQSHAAGSELRAALANAFGEGRVVKVSSRDVTRMCSACLGICEVTETSHACEHCGERWDRDANACRNLLRALRERSAAGELGEAARGGKLSEKKESRSDRLRRGRKKPIETGSARDPA